MAKTIALTRGYTCTVDDQDYEWLSQYKWHASSVGRVGRKLTYAARTVQHKHILMHRLIVGLLVYDRRYEIHHKDNDTLNNQRENLQIVTYAQHYEITNRERRHREWIAILKENGVSIKGLTEP